MQCGTFENEIFFCGDLWGGVYLDDRVPIGEKNIQNGSKLMFMYYDLCFGMLFAGIKVKKRKRLWHL